MTTGILQVLTLIMNTALTIAIPVMNMLQLNRLMRDNFCVFLSGARRRTGMGSETRYTSDKILQARNTAMIRGDMFA